MYEYIRIQVIRGLNTYLIFVFRISSCIIGHYGTRGICPQVFLKAIVKSLFLTIGAHPMAVAPARPGGEAAPPDFVLPHQMGLRKF